MAPSRFLDEVPEGSCRTIGMEAPDTEGQSAYPPGAEVYHDEYGPGVVQRAWTSDGNLVVQVRFLTGRVAKFLPAYARLERISSGE